MINSWTVENTSGLEALLLLTNATEMISNQSRIPCHYEPWSSILSTEVFKGIRKTQIKEALIEYSTMPFLFQPSVLHRGFTGCNNYQIIHQRNPPIAGRLNFLNTATSILDIFSIILNIGWWNTMCLCKRGCSHMVLVTTLPRGPEPCTALHIALQ